MLREKEAADAETERRGREAADAEKERREREVIEQQHNEVNELANNSYQENRMRGRSPDCNIFCMASCKKHSQIKSTICN